jgi:NADPH:quinone reductase
MLSNKAIRPRVAARISFDEVADAHRHLEAGGLQGKLVLCPSLAPDQPAGALRTTGQPV